jgi:lipoprotein NlpD
MHLPALSTPTPRLPRFLAFVAVALIVAGCATRRPAPVEDRALARAQPAPVVTPSRAPGPPAAEPPPPSTYTVKRGDTLHQIALDSGLDYRELAAWNNIENVNRIFPGQVLRLAPPGANPPATGASIAPAPAPADASSGVTTAPLRTVPAIGEGRPASADAARVASAPPPAAPLAPSAPAAASGTLKTSPKAVKEPYSEQAVRDLNLAASAGPAPADAIALPAATPPPAAPPAAPSSSVQAAASPPAAAVTPPPASKGAAASGTAGDPDHLDWAWPAKGRIVAGFSETANLKGIDIAGTAGEPVRASAAGRVVYAGSGLRGYGKLIIIKHNATYLSAYAHNREILVKEGQQVTRGQKIAEMGNSDADQVKLHFEIRRLGKPMDPTKYLPPA